MVGNDAATLRLLQVEGPIDGIWISVCMKTDMLRLGRQNVVAVQEREVSSSLGLAKARGRRASNICTSSTHVVKCEGLGGGRMEVRELCAVIQCEYIAFSMKFW